MEVKESKFNTEAIIIAKRRLPCTFEDMCLDKLKQLGRSTAAEWSTAMGYTTSNALAKVIRRIKAKSPEKLKIIDSRKPRLYEAV
jgi:hypothetical protein